VCQGPETLLDLAKAEDVRSLPGLKCTGSRRSWQISRHPRPRSALEYSPTHMNSHPSPRSALHFHSSTHMNFPTHINCPTHMNVHPIGAHIGRLHLMKDAPVTAQAPNARTTPHRQIATSDLHSGAVEMTVTQGCLTTKKVGLNTASGERSLPVMLPLQIRTDM